MTEEINSINPVLPRTDDAGSESCENVGEKATGGTNVDCISSLHKIIHYQTDHQHLLDDEEVVAVLQPFCRTILLPIMCHLFSSYQRKHSKWWSQKIDWEEAFERHNPNSSFRSSKIIKITSSPRCLICGRPGQGLQWPAKAVDVDVDLRGDNVHLTSLGVGRPGQGLRWPNASEGPIEASAANTLSESGGYTTNDRSVISNWKQESGRRQLSRNVVLGRRFQLPVRTS